MKVSNQMTGIIMLSTTLLIIILSFLHSIPFIELQRGTTNFETDLDYPLFGSGRGTYSGTYYDAITANPTDSLSYAIIYLSWIFQLIGWIVYLIYQKEQEGEKNLLNKIFSHQNIFISNLMSIFGFIVWRFRFTVDDEYSVGWGYFFLFGMVFITAIVNTIIWSGNIKSVSVTIQNDTLNAPMSDKTKTLETSSELKISRKERNEIIRKAKEEEKLLAKQNADIIEKRELEEQLKTRIETFRKVVLRSSELRIEQLATMLEMKENDLLKWLYNLPDEFGFVINKDIIEFDTLKIGDSIDKLLSSFDKVEQNKDGKIRD